MNNNYSIINVIILSFVTQWGQTAIYTASAEGHTETVKVLLQAKADTEIQQTVTASMHSFLCRPKNVVVEK